MCNSFWRGQGEVDFDGQVLSCRARNPSHAVSGPRPLSSRNLCLGTFGAGAATGVFPGDVLAARGGHSREAPARGGAVSATGN